MQTYRKIHKFSSVNLLARGKNYGISNTGTFKYYASVLEKINLAISGIINDIEGTIVNSTEVVNGISYKKVSLN